MDLQEFGISWLEEKKYPDVILAGGLPKDLKSRQDILSASSEAESRDLFSHSFDDVSEARDWLIGL